MLEALFGNSTAEKVLLYVANYGEGHINGIARTFSISPSQVQKQLMRLEAGGVLVARTFGNARIFTINQRWAFRDELLKLLEKALLRLPEEDIKKYFRQRTRPRRTGKRL